MSSKPPVALVTGAARRIGAAIAAAVHEAGYCVALHYRSSRQDADALAARLNALRADSARSFQADLVAVDACRELVAGVQEHFGALHLLVNNASCFFPTPINAVTEAEWDTLLACNLKAPFFLTQAAAPALKDTTGSVVNLADIHAERPLKAYPVYATSKAGVVMLTKALAKELGPGVRVNAVSPGSILWPEGAHGADVAQREILERTALKRQGQPQDIADAVLYLATASYVTGHVLVVDGGRSLNL